MNILLDTCTIQIVQKDPRRNLSKGKKLSSIGHKMVNFSLYFLSKFFVCKYQCLKLGISVTKFEENVAT